jgi:hypothetical protein
MNNQYNERGSALLDIPRRMRCRVILLYVTEIMWREEVTKVVGDYFNNLSSSS